MRDDPESNYFLTVSRRIIYARPRNLKRDSLPQLFDINGDVAQLGERRVRNAEARGSIPLISTKKNPEKSNKE